MDLLIALLLFNFVVHPMLSTVGGKFGYYYQVGVSKGNIVALFQNPSMDTFLGFFKWMCLAIAAGMLLSMILPYSLLVSGGFVVRILLMLASIILASVALGWFETK